MPAPRTGQRIEASVARRILSWACLLAVAVAAAAATPVDDAAPDFLAAVGGDWRGGAVHTPAGPFSYDIRFAPDEAGCVSGVAEPGGVHHSWKFCPAEAGLALEFLSDFGGNERPLLLQLRGIDAGTLVFHSETLGFLKVLARLEADCLRLQVLHHDRLHVEIHLQRPPPGDGLPATGRCPWAMPVSESL